MKINCIVIFNAVNYHFRPASSSIMLAFAVIMAEFDRNLLNEIWMGNVISNNVNNFNMEKTELMRNKT